MGWYDGTARLGNTSNLIIGSNQVLGWKMGKRGNYLDKSYDRCQSIFQAFRSPSKYRIHLITSNVYGDLSILMVVMAGPETKDIFGLTA